MFQNACIGVLFVGSWHEDTAVAGPHHPDCHFSSNMNYITTNKHLKTYVVHTVSHRLLSTHVYTNSF